MKNNHHLLHIRPSETPHGPFYGPCRSNPPLIRNRNCFFLERVTEISNGIYLPFACDIFTKCLGVMPLQIRQGQSDLA